MRWEKALKEVIEMKRATLICVYRLSRSKQQHRFYCTEDEYNSYWPTPYLKEDSDRYLGPKTYREVYNHVKFLRSIPKQLDDALELEVL